MSYKTLMEKTRKYMGVKQPRGEEETIHLMLSCGFEFIPNQLAWRHKESLGKISDSWVRMYSSYPDFEERLLELGDSFEVKLN